MVTTTIEKPAAKRKPQPFIGLPLAVTVYGGKELFSSLEDVALLFAGPRTGKSTAFAIPWILCTPGPALVTENKNGLHNHTRGARERIGKVFAFDPEQIAVTAEQGWWFNPLREVTTPTKAAALAELFESAEGSGAAAAAAAKGVDFFPERAKSLLRGLFLAAAVSEGWTQEEHHYTGQPYFLRDVQSWLAAPEAENPVPIQILDATPYREVLNELVGVFRSAPQERSGVFSTAQVITKSLTDRQIMDWVNPRPGEEDGLHGRTLFDPAKFIEGSNTLYSLSSDGYGSAKSLVTALTVAVCETGEKKAAKLPKGRLAVPLLCVLDEAANVCPWSKLPAMYSHYGSRGILVLTILQSYSQGVRVWGEHGMEALMQASNIRIYAGGNLPSHLLTLFSDAIGDYYYTTPGSPASKGGSAGPRQEHKDKIFDVSELSSLPRGRAIILSSGNRPALVRTVPWMAGPYKALVEESVRKYDPKAEETLKGEISEFQRSLANPNLTGDAV